MAYCDQDQRKERAGAAVASSAVIASLALLASLGRAAPVDAVIAEPWTNVVSISELAPPDPPPAERNAAANKEGGAAPPNLHAKASPVIRTQSPITPKNPLPASEIPGKGAESDAGASNAPGPGSGAGGLGNGTGAGRGGDGTGGGGGRIRPPVKISGEIRDRDYPKVLRKARIGGTAIAWFTVNTDGRAKDCQITQSSGNGELDALTCRLITERFRYRPATGPDGQPVTDKTGWKQRWWVENRRGDDLSAGED